MRFTNFAIAAFSLSLATAMPTKRAIVLPGNDGTGNGVVPSVGVAVDDGVQAIEGTVATIVKGGSDNSKRAIVLPGNDGTGNGVVPSVGAAVDGVVQTVEGTFAGVVKGGDASDAE